MHNHLYKMKLWRFHRVLYMWDLGCFTYTTHKYAPYKTWDYASQLYKTWVCPTGFPQLCLSEIPWLFHDFSMTFNAFFHDYFTRLKFKIYEKCCNNHHTRPGHTFAIVTISKYVLDLQRVLSVSFTVKTFVNNVVRSVFHKHEVLQNLQNKFVQIWVFHDFFHDLLNSMTFPWPIIFHDFSWLFHDQSFSMTFPWPWEPWPHIKLGTMFSTGARKCFKRQILHVTNLAWENPLLVTSWHS